jgi:hypothetical protein
MLLSGDVKAGDTVHVDWNPNVGDLVFTSAQPVAV